MIGLKIHPERLLRVILITIRFLTIISIFFWDVEIETLLNGLRKVFGREGNMVVSIIVFIE
jgi:hypothetical protein